MLSLCGMFSDDLVNIFICILNLFKNMFLKQYEHYYELKPNQREGGNFMRIRIVAFELGCYIGVNIPLFAQS